MPFNLFHKKKEPEEEATAMPPQEETPNQETATETLPKEDAPQEQPTTEAPTTSPEETTTQEPAAAAVETEPEQPPEPVTTAPTEETKAPEAPAKTYLKAMPLRELSDVDTIKAEVENGNIIILKVTPLAAKSIEDVKTAINDLYEFSETSGGDIARLGEERVVVCPKNVRVWREKTPAPVVKNQGLPTSAA
ncbi:MAG: cell division protein SepF [Candidatus Bathyarchaeota archaeon]|nr:cell division protein SepF [Candidatus Bathyarchaeota archaeon]